MILEELIDINYEDHQFRLFTQDDLRTLLELYREGIITEKFFIDSLPVNIDQVDYSTFLVKQSIIAEPIYDRFEILDL